MAASEVNRNRAIETEQTNSYASNNNNNKSGNNSNSKNNNGLHSNYDSNNNNNKNSNSNTGNNNNNNALSNNSHIASEENSVLLDNQYNSALRSPMAAHNMNRSNMNLNINSMIHNAPSLISVDEHEKIMARIQKYADLDEVLDFMELYKKYKVVLACLDESEENLRRYEHKYNKFIADLKANLRSNIDMEDELFFLRNLVEEQRSRIDEDKKYESDIVKHIKVSKNLINEHLKLMREEHKKEMKLEQDKKQCMFNA